MIQGVPSLTKHENPTARRSTRRSNSRAFLETVMAENSSKSDQIRKLREIRMLAGEKVTADCEADAKRASKSFALKKESKADS
jgi:hypothetical protein